jgi:hypothetical protein
MKAIKSFSFALLLLTPSLGHGMIPGRPRSMLSSHKPTQNELYNFAGLTYLDKEGFENLIDALTILYEHKVNQEALKQAIVILNNKRKEAIEYYNQHKTLESTGEISTIDLALNRLEDPNTSIHSFEKITTPNNQPEIALINKVLDPIVLKLTQEFSQSHNLGEREILTIQNEWFKNSYAKTFEQRFTTPKLKRISPPQQRTPFEKAVTQSYYLVKEAPQRMSEPSSEAEEMYAQSLGQGSGMMPRTYQFNWPKFTFPQPKPMQSQQQQRTFRQPTYKIAPESASKALKQAEFYGAGYQ